ncbi:MAG: ribbon-helix-helix protein, CopG family [Alphaproteobacteria bacterium]|nr:ribbon-helix-helix protein, CopG family [Alphaproteobacteria bacterium]
MSETEQITVSLPRDVVERVRRAVQAGEYASVAEAVEAAVILWDAGQHADEPDTETLRRLVAEGLANGEPIDTDDVFSALNARLAKLRAAE